MATKKDLTVKWILPKKAIIKFQEEADKTYDIDKAVKDLESIKAGTAISVTIEDDKVVKIESKTATKTEVKKESPKEEKKTEVKDDKDVETKNWTIEAMTSGKDVVKFKEGKVKWYVIAENVIAEFKDLKKGDIVSVKIGTVKQKGKDKPGVIAVESSIQVEEKDIKGSEYTTEPTTYNKGSSIERQCAMKGAVEITVTMIEKNPDLSISKYNELINDISRLTKVCYKAIQEA